MPERALGRLPAEERHSLDSGWAYRGACGTEGNIVLEGRRSIVAATPAALRNGQNLPKAKFEFMRADGQGQPIKYFEIELENVLIGGIEPSIEPGTILDEHVSLKFSKVKWKYTQQKIGGGVGGSTIGGWDLAANTVAA